MAYGKHPLAGIAAALLGILEDLGKLLMVLIDPNVCRFN